MIARRSMNLNAIAENFDISRPAISQQIKILTECGLVTIKQHGRERYCEAKLEALSEVSGWVEQYKEFWEARLNKLGDLLTDLQNGKNKKKRKNK